jgi:hypothetical protein
MPNFNGIRNVRGAEFNPDRIKSYLTARAGQLSKTAQPVATTSAAKPVELSALAQAWMHTWSLPEMDPSSVKWVGVNPSDFYGQPGRARLAVMEQKTGLGALATDYFFGLEENQQRNRSNPKSENQQLTLYLLAPS